MSFRTKADFVRKKLIDICKVCKFTLKYFSSMKLFIKWECLEQSFVPLMMFFYIEQMIT